MTFIVAWATPDLGLIAADRREWRIEAPGAPPQRVSDNLGKIHPTGDGWVATGGSVDLAAAVARTFADFHFTSVQDLTPHVERIRRELPELLGPPGVAKSWLISGGMERRCIGVDWWTGAIQLAPPGCVGVGAPYPFTQEQIGDLVAEYGRQIAAHVNKGRDRTPAGVGGAKAATRDLFAQVRARCGPEGSVSPALDIATLE